MGNETFYWDGLNEFVKAKINASECSFRVLRADVSKYRPEAYKSEKLKNPKKFTE